MAKLTVLQMVQDILSSMDASEVNSIADTPESLQVATIIKTKYYDIVTRGTLPENRKLFSLDSAMDATRPVLMTIPANVSQIEWIKYFDTNPADSQSQSQFGAFSHDLNIDLVTNPIWTATSTTSNTIGLGIKTFQVSAGLTINVGQGAVATSSAGTMSGTVFSYAGTSLVLSITSTTGTGTSASWTITGSPSNIAPIYKYVTMLPVEQFLEMVNLFNIQENDVESFTFTEDGNNFTFYYKNDHQPMYCTVISNKYVVFDMFDASQDSTLQTSKVMCYGYLTPLFILEDSFIPDLSDDQFPLLFNEAKALAFYELKQMPHAKAEQEIKRGWSAIQKDKSISDKPGYFDQLPSFGRQPRTGGYGTIWPRLKSMN